MTVNCAHCCRPRLSRATSPDSPWSFVVLFAGFLCAAIVNGCLYSFGVILPELMDHFGETRAKIGKYIILTSLQSFTLNMRKQQHNFIIRFDNS